MAGKDKSSSQAKPAKSRKGVGGRPSKYKKEFAEQAGKLCRLGATDKEIAYFFGVAERTLNDWKKAHPEFMQSLKAGKLLADAEVADKLYNRALGYEHDDVKIFNDQGKPLIVPCKKNYPPDTAAAIFWLKNRQPDKWREKPVESDQDETATPVQVIFNVREPVKPE